MNDEEIIKFVDEWVNSLGMSDFQTRHFVVNSQVTNYRRVRQALVEIDTRIGSKKQIERNRKKRIIEKQIILRDMEHAEDELRRQLLEVDLEQAEWDIHMFDKKERMVQNEIDNFIKLIKDLVPNMEELKQYNEHNELEERNYWITRMAKQAAMDLNTIGRIGQGNMDSILMMPLEDVKQTLQLAVKYNGVLGKGMEAIGRTAMEQLKLQENTITYIDDLANKQLKLENKSQGEDI